MAAIATLTGEIRIAAERCAGCQAKPCVAACPEGILALHDGAPMLAKPAKDVQKGLCRECLACELVCQLDGAGGLTIVLPIEGLEP